MTIDLRLKTINLLLFGLFLVFIGSLDLFFQAWNWW